MTEEEMRRMRMMQDNSMVPARYIEGQEELRDSLGPFDTRILDNSMLPEEAFYDPNASIVPEDQQRSLMQLIQNAKLQYDMLVSQGVLDPRVTPFDPMAIIAHGLSLEGSGMPGDMGGAFIPPVPDEQLPFDTNMQLDPLRRRNVY